MKKAGAINRKISKLQKQLDEIQKDCKHDEKIIKMDDKGSAMWTCNDCESRLKYPTPQEILDWINK